MCHICDHAKNRSEVPRIEFQKMECWDALIYSILGHPENALRPFLSVDTNAARSIVSPKKHQNCFFFGSLAGHKCNTQREIRLRVARGPARLWVRYSYPIGVLGEQNWMHIWRVTFKCTVLELQYVELSRSPFNREIRVESCLHKVSAIRAQNRLWDTITNPK